MNWQRSRRSCTNSIVARRYLAERSAATSKGPPDKRAAAQTTRNNPMYGGNAGRWRNNENQCPLFGRRREEQRSTSALGKPPRRYAPRHDFAVTAAQPRVVRLASMPCGKRICARGRHPPHILFPVQFPSPALGGGVGGGGWAHADETEQSMNFTSPPRRDVIARSVCPGDSPERDEAICTLPGRTT